MNAVADEKYTGPVCFVDGWHYTVEKDAAGNDQPAERLFSFGDGTYRQARSDDQSHNEQFHQRYATVELEDGGPGVRVNEDELAAIQELLAKRRNGEETT